MCTNMTYVDILNKTIQLQYFINKCTIRKQTSTLLKYICLLKLPYFFF